MSCAVSSANHSGREPPGRTTSAADWTSRAPERVRQRLGLGERLAGVGHVVHHEDLLAAGLGDAEGGDRPPVAGPLLHPHREELGPHRGGQRAAHEDAAPGHAQDHVGLEARGDAGAEVAHDGAELEPGQLADAACARRRAPGTPPMRSTAQASPTPTPSGCSARGRLGRAGLPLPAGCAAARAGRRAGFGGLFFFVVFFSWTSSGGRWRASAAVALGPGRGI